MRKDSAWCVHVYMSSPIRAEYSLQCPAIAGVDSGVSTGQALPPQPPAAAAPMLQALNQPSVRGRPARAQSVGQ